jgi:hypothetical protein
MIKTSFLFACTLTALAQDGIPLQFHSPAPFSQQNSGRGMPPFGAPGPPGKQPGFFRIDRQSSITLQFNAVAEPPLANPGDLQLAWLINKTQNVWHRFVIDKVHHEYFGYDASAQPAASGEYSVTIGPLSTVPERDELAFLGISTPLSPTALPKYPGPQLVKSGDTIALDVLVSSDGKQKIVDYIQFSAAASAPSTGISSTTEPKDFTLDDGPIKTDFEGFVLINGHKFEGPTWFDKKPGSTLWFSFPDQGRFVLSLVPHAGFQKVGRVRDNVVSFEADGQQYEVWMKSPIVSSGGTWRLYVLHDPSYQPEHSSLHMKLDGLSAGTPMVIGGTDRIENLLPK